jgi:YidC/Oxa1 family membrane protein insertase
MVSAEQMKKLSPRMEEIKKKYPDDRDRQNMEMMKLYQEAKVNPLGGCLPLLLQLPIWAALFTTLRTSYELYAEPFFGVWSDLTSKDPTYLLPLALGITMIVTQRLQPQMTMDKSQAFMMAWLMPIFFTAIMMNYPAGLSLYIFTNNLLSIVQQYALRKYLARGAPTPAGATR